MVLYIFKCIHFSNYPSYLQTFLKPRISTNSLRGAHTLSLQRPLTTAYGIHSFSYYVAKFWNSLLDSLKKVSDFTEFRRNLFEIYYLINLYVNFFFFLSLEDTSYIVKLH